VTLENNLFVLSECKATGPGFFPLDIFLCSLVKARGKSAICIILSGVNIDGAIGLIALREHGCLIIAIAEKSYQYIRSPLIRMGLVDYTLLPEDMFDFLLRYIAHLSDRSIIIPRDLSTDLKELLTLIKEKTGVDFSHYKRNTLLRRTQRRLNLLHINTLSAYIYYVHQHASEIKIILNELLINVTSFFRDSEAFEELKQTLLKKLTADAFKNRCFRVWVPACSTGEETYSIAIILQECMDSLQLSFDVRIYGTDIDHRAIETARIGIFSSEIKKHISSERLKKYFVQEGALYKINPRLRKMVVFSTQNIIADPPFSKLDLISCRNLLIYLDTKLQNSVLSLFNFSLNNQGLLFIGSSESIGDLVDSYLIINKKWKIFELKNYKIYHHPLGIEISSPPQLVKIQDAKRTTKMTLDNEQHVDDFIKNIVIESVSPACIIIDENGDITYNYGQVSKFLELSSGRSRLHFIDMVPSNLKSRLQKAIDEARYQKKEIHLNRQELTKYDEKKLINIKIKPITNLKKIFIFIMIEEVLLSENPPLTNINAMLKIKNELAYSKNSLQIAIEELQSSNEELQSTNEELQSLNEEAATVNSELEYRIEQLSSANDDIRSILDHTEIATIVLDKDLCIKRFTPKATEMVNLISSDLGRPIQHIVFNVQPYEKIVEDVRTVLKTLEAITTEGVNREGHSFVIRIIPYISINHVINGVIIIFLDSQSLPNNKLDKLKSDLDIIEKFNDTLLNTISDSAVILDKNSIIIIANYHFLKQFNLKNNDITGHSIYQLNLKWDKPSLKKIIEATKQEKSLSHVATLNISADEIAHLTLLKISSSTLLLTLS
jgi:two-component system CheB/CheR fusion protein